MVPNLTCHELTVGIMIERVEIMREDKSSKDRIGNFPSIHTVVIQYASLVWLTTRFP